MSGALTVLQRKWLEKLQAFSPAPIKLQCKRITDENPAGEPSYFTRYPTLAEFRWENFDLADWRTVLPNEIVFDADFLKFTQAIYWARRLYVTLKMNGIPFVAGPSGGKGYHFHLFLDCRGVERITGWLRMRLALWNWILDRTGVPDTLRAEGNGFCPTVVRFSDRSPVHLIREFGSVKNTMKVQVVGIPGSSMTRIIPRGFKVWKVPERLMLKLDYGLPDHQRANCALTETKEPLCDIKIPNRYKPYGDSKLWAGCVICRRG
jgi:hypothetical protein